MKNEIPLAEVAPPTPRENAELVEHKVPDADEHHAPVQAQVYLGKRVKLPRSVFCHRRTNFL